MRLLSGVVLGPRPIEMDSDLKGMIIGMATVRTGVQLIVKGVVTGDLILEPGSRAEIDGTVIGTVRNHGGTLEVRGTIGGLEESSSEVWLDLQRTSLNS